jgi:hypothetical protein
MKRVGFLWQLRAHRQARRGKRSRPEVAAFEDNQ